MVAAQSRAFSLQIALTSLELSLRNGTVWASLSHTTITFKMSSMTRLRLSYQMMIAEQKRRDWMAMEVHLSPTHTCCL